MSKLPLILLIILALIIITGCTKYVCYEGSVQKDSSKCPVLPSLVVQEDTAGRATDNFGNAVAIAKHNSYTRVNMYSKNSTWYSNVLFTNPDTGKFTQVLLKISGQTGDVTCVTGCEYFNQTIPNEVLAN